MARETTYTGVLGDLQRLTAPLLANRVNLPHLEGSITQFLELLSQSQDVAKQQAALAAAKQDASKQLRSLLIEAQRLATVLRLALKQHYGIRSEKLTEFGVQPFRGRLRKAKPAPEVPETPAPASPGPPTST